MLYRIIKIKQPCPADAYILTHAVAKHFFYKIRRDYLGIVIHQKNIIAFGRFDTEIGYPGIIKCIFPFNHTNPAVLFLQLFVICKRAFFCTVIFYNYDFIIWISTIFQNRLHTGVQVVNMVLIRNVNRDHRLFIPCIYRMINTRNLRRLCRCRNVLPFIMCI